MKFPKASVFVSNTETKAYFKNGSVSLNVENIEVARAIIAQETYTAFIHNLVETDCAGNKIVLDSKIYLFDSRDARSRLQLRGPSDNPFVLAKCK